jgi:beta-glucanase (GH16 family)
VIRVISTQRRQPCSPYHSSPPCSSPSCRWPAITVAYCADAKLRPPDRLPAPPAGQQWQLAFHDEFDGPTLDASKWDIPEYKRRDANWSRKAISLDGQGHLVLSMLKDGDQCYDGCVRTIGKFEHAFGYYVARIRFQKQPGHWPAFWLYNASVGQVGNEGRDGSEIDILEKPWLDDRVPHTIHWDGYGKDHKSQGTVAVVPGVMVGWHTFSLMWTPE